MKIESLEINDYPPIKNIKIENLGSTVIIAGANGSGKTRLRQAIVQTIQGSPLMNMKLLATRREEVDKYFQNDFLEIVKGHPNALLNSYIQSRRYGGGKYTGSLVQIDSERNIQTIQYTPVNWLGTDPDDQDTPGTFYFNQFGNRWQDFMNYIHQKSAVRDKKLADELKKAPSDGINIIRKNPDPLEKYKTIFRQLLPNKELQDIDPASPKEFQYKNLDGSILPFSTLSSGEQEVVKIVFDIIRKDIRHSVIIVDEPELHLHPTLAFKLIEALKNIGDHTNQFIFLTHSADLISTYYSTGNVYFVDNNQTGSNQAHKLSELNHTHSELVKLIGENLGLFAVGKKLVFVEGETASIDRLTYHSIAEKVFSDIKIIPVGSVENIITLNTIEEQIRNSIFGINFYMIRDRDGLSNMQIELLENNNRIRCLKKRHIENYFLDSEILAKVAKKLYIRNNQQEFTQIFIEEKLKTIAGNSLKITLMYSVKDYLGTNNDFDIPSVKSVDSKEIDIIKDEFCQLTEAALQKLASNLNQTNIKNWLDKEEERLIKCLETGDWKNEYYGKIIFSKFCGDVFKEDKIRIREAYVDIALEEKPEVFADITSIFQSLV